MTTPQISESARTRTCGEMSCDECNELVSSLRSEVGRLKLQRDTALDILVEHNLESRIPDELITESKVKRLSEESASLKSAIRDAAIFMQSLSEDGCDEFGNEKHFLACRACRAKNVLSTLKPILGDSDSKPIHAPNWVCGKCGKKYAFPAEACEKWKVEYTPENPPVCVPCCEKLKPILEEKK